jgi:alpha-aminoadipate carrier protein LysW
VSSNVAQCPICDASVQLPADAALAELIACPECGCGLEITSLEPPCLAEAPSEEEDWGQ